MARIHLAIPFLILLSSQCYALNYSKCDGFMNDGLYKKYEYRGIDQPLTKATKKLGSTHATSFTSTEGSTASSDPKYWSHITTSEWQFTTSWGDCDSFGLQELEKNRELYFVQNKDEVVKEIAMGQGEHLNVLASFSLCDQDAVRDFSSRLQESTQKFINKSEGKPFGKVIDEAVRGDHGLAGRCFAFEG